MDTDSKAKWEKAWCDRESRQVTEYDAVHDIILLRREEMLSVFREHATLPHDGPRTFLDLGAGTGAATFSILKKYPDARPTLIDGSEPMLEQARERIRRELAELDPTVRRLLNPHEYPVGLCERLYAERTRLVQAARKQAREI